MTGYWFADLAGPDDELFREGRETWLPVLAEHGGGCYPLPAGFKTEEHCMAWMLDMGLRLEDE